MQRGINLITLSLSLLNSKIIKKKKTRTKDKQNKLMGFEAYLTGGVGGQYQRQKVRDHLWKTNNDGTEENQRIKEKLQKTKIER